jgi:hypothetical protein
MDIKVKNPNSPIDTDHRGPNVGSGVKSGRLLRQTKRDLL